MPLFFFLHFLLFDFTPPGRKRPLFLHTENIYEKLSPKCERSFWFKYLYYLQIADSSLILPPDFRFNWKSLILASVVECIFCIKNYALLIHWRAHCLAVTKQPHTTLYTFNRIFFRIVQLLMGKWHDLRTEHECLNYVRSNAICLLYNASQLNMFVVA